MTCHLIIDTGAQRTTLSERIAKRSKVIKLADQPVINYNGRHVSATLLRLDSLELNGLTIKNVRAYKARIPYLLDGLLGWDVLRHYKIVIDYSKRQLRLS